MTRKKWYFSDQEIEVIISCIDSTEIDIIGDEKNFGENPDTRKRKSELDKLRNRLENNYYKQGGSWKK